MIYPVVPHLIKISTGLPFLFRSPEPLFLLRCKRKSGFGPSRAGKKQLQDKTHHFPTKEKTVLPAPSVRRHSTRRARAVSNGRPMAPAGQAEKRSPAGQAATNKTEKASLFAEGKSRFVKFLCWADMISAPTNVRWWTEKRLPARGTPHP